MKKKHILFISLSVIGISIICAGICYYFWWDSNYNSPKFEYVCEDGYELNELNDCVKILEESETIPNYSCNNGYELEETICARYETKKPIVKWSCPEGYKMKDGIEPQVCYRVLTESATKNYYCVGNYVLDGSKCVRFEMVYANKTPMCSGVASMFDDATQTCVIFGAVTKTCPSGYYVKERFNNGYVTCYNYPTWTYDCPSDYIKEGNQCFKFFEAIDANYTSSCRSGYKLNSDGQTCSYTEYDVPSYNYQCSSGYYLDNKTCVKKITDNAIVNYTCSEDFEYDYVNGTCIKYDRKKAKTIVIEKKK